MVRLCGNLNKYILFELFFLVPPTKFLFQKVSEILKLSVQVFRGKRSWVERRRKSSLNQMTEKRSISDRRKNIDTPLFNRSIKRIHVDVYNLRIGRRKLLIQDL
jgi:hypothetical protein